MQSKLRKKVKKVVRKYLIFAYKNRLACWPHVAANQGSRENRDDTHVTSRKQREYLINFCCQRRFQNQIQLITWVNSAIQSLTYIYLSSKSAMLRMPILLEK